MSNQNRWSRFVKICFQNANTILIHDVNQFVSYVRMSEIEHDVAIHFQWRQQKWKIFENFCTKIDKNTERWSKKKISKNFWILTCRCTCFWANATTRWNIFFQFSNIRNCCSTKNSCEFSSWTQKWKLKNSMNQNMNWLNHA